MSGPQPHNGAIPASATNRRAFLRQAALAGTGCVAHVWLNAACAPRRQRQAWTAPVNPVVSTTPFARLEAVGPDAWAVISTPTGGDRTTFANGGIVAGRSGVVVFEGFYRDAGARWLAEEARRLTGRWPTHVVVSHYHVDHASGLPGYAQDAGLPRVHCTDITRRLALGGTPVAPVRSAALERAFADVVVTSSREVSTIDLGNRVLQLMPFAGHTASDLTLHDEDAGLVWSGDLVWYRMFPNYVDADPRALAASVQQLATRLRSARAVLVPGHGGLVRASAMTEYRALLDHVEAVARAGHAAGTPAQAAAASFAVPPALGEWMASRVSVERAMQAWYRVLGTP
ncbi:MAG: MBL fold metallo-hydrolase [Gemmatimonadaceae bacterium]|nr:MBL fold metallo-hydrolase [Gemmatimonadaceae bacterium]